MLIKNIFFYEISIKNQLIDFILIGPNIESVPNTQLKYLEYKKQIECFRNVFFIDQIPANLIYSYLLKADLLLVTYLADNFPEQLANPHKFMEYLSSGKMIVSTNTFEYRRLAEKKMFLMSKKNYDLPQLFQIAIKNLEYWNSSEKQNARKKFALENTYDKQIDRIAEYLSDALNL